MRIHSDLSKAQDYEDLLVEYAELEAGVTEWKSKYDTAILEGDAARLERNAITGELSDFSTYVYVSV